MSRSVKKHQRAVSRARTKEARRLEEREQVSGEIRTPDDITAKRAKRSAQGPTGNASAVQKTPVQKTPVSSRRLVPERTFSGRMIVLTLVTLVVISFLVPTVRTYFQQRAEITELEAEIAEEEQRQSELQTELARWEDPEFVRQQARERINLVMPGERRYHVVGEPETAEDLPEHHEPGEVRTDLPWGDALWDSVVRAGVEETDD